MATLRTVPRAGGQESYIVCYTPPGESKKSKTFRDRAEAEAFADRYGGWGRGVTGPKRRPLADRLWERVAKGAPDECWPWTGPLNKGDDGYGYLASGGHASPKVYAHRVAYEVTYGPIPEGLLVRHHCDNPPCCNPAHLAVGTHQDNMQDALGRKRFSRQTSTHCANGHARTPEGTRLYRAPEGYIRRVCRSCERDASRRKTARRQAQRQAS